MDAEKTKHAFCPLNSQVIEYRVGALEEAIREISMAVKSIAANTEQIARLEERHAETREALDRAFASIKSADGRLSKIEIEMPSIKESSRWIKSGTILIVGTVILAAIKVALHF